MVAVCSEDKLNHLKENMLFEHSGSAMVLSVVLFIFLIIWLYRSKIKMLSEYHTKIRYSRCQEFLSVCLQISGSGNYPASQLRHSIIFMVIFLALGLSYF